MKIAIDMKHNKLVWTVIAFVLGIALFGCKKDNPETLTPKITDDKVEATTTSATFTWTVDWPGKLISVVEVSENEDMSDSQIYGSESETENHSFTVTVTDLKVATNYYYRILVWNMNYAENKFEFEKKSFSTAETGILNGVFSVSSSVKVNFSKGNLQYIGSAASPYWKFAEHQWDYLATLTGQNSTDENVDRDLFCWGTSGWNCGNTYYQPWDTYSNGTTSGALYGPPGLNNLMGPYAYSDWGVYNSIHNGGNQAGLWRTLSKDEWRYVFNTRSTISGIRYAAANVNGVNGMLLIPDDWDLSSFSLQNTNFTSRPYFNDNTITLSQWNLLEQLGVVFLPAAGYRNGTSVSGVGVSGDYWSSSHSNTNDYAGGIYFSSNSSSYSFSPIVASGRNCGHSVRLVREVN